ncbi:MAG: hypothetical protein FWG98_03380 [Candidatus Cloacimonetes bacterium]|nr:hypothetical protein [Candidatus Cloacimonadota bacterium]
MKKNVSFLFLFLVFNIFSLCLNAQTQVSNQPSRVIHLVYDDSGSMIFNDRIPGRYYGRWAHARYAMEVFISKMEKDDLLRIYFMEDFFVSGQPRDGLIREDQINETVSATLESMLAGNRRGRDPMLIQGSEDSAVRIGQFRNRVTYSAGTPFDPVLMAYADLLNQSADQRWLIVFTDGHFNQIAGLNFNETEEHRRVDVERIYRRFVSDNPDIKIIHFAMGTYAAEVREAMNRYFHKAENDDEILREVNEFGKRVFNRNALSFAREGNQYKFDIEIPMQELVVFAQGRNVVIQSMIRGSETINWIDAPVTVRYNPEFFPANRQRPPRLERPTNVIRPTLLGSLLTYRNIPAGEYTINIEGSPENVEIFYRPALMLDIKVSQDHNLFFNREINFDDLVNDFPHGTYSFDVKLVPIDTEIEISENALYALIGDADIIITYKNPEGDFSNHRSGDSIDIMAGDFDIRVTASFLGINHVEKRITGVSREWGIGDYAKNWGIVFIVLLVILIIFINKIRNVSRKKFPSKYSGNNYIIEKIDGSKEKPSKRPFEFRFTDRKGACEKGTLKISTNARLPRVELEALGGGRMRILNPDRFTNARLREYGIESIKFGASTIENLERTNYEINCSVVFTTVFKNNDDKVTTNTLQIR